MVSNNGTTLPQQLSTKSGNVANIANIANYYSGLQSSIVVVNGVVSGSGLVLAFNLKEDKFDAVLPLLRTPPCGTTLFYTLSLKNYISRDEVYVGTTLVSQALSAGRVSPMLAASKKYIPLDPASSTVIRTG